MTWTLLYNIKGVKGDTGNTGLTGAPGLPGVNAVDNDAAVAGYMTTTGTSQTKTALTNAFAADKAAPTTATTIGVYTKARNVYNLTPSHIRKSRAAVVKARAGTGFFRLAVLGDSTVAGYGASVLTSFPNVLKDQLAAAGVPSAGSGIVSPWTGTLVDTRWTFGAGWVSMSSSSSARANSTDTTAAVFTSTTAGTIARVYFASDVPAGTLAITIDGGAPVTVTPSPVNAVNVYEVTGLANTTHTISIARNSTGKGQIFGAEVRSSATSGVLLYNGGITGQIVATLALARWYDTVNFAAALGTPGWAADMVIIRCETNDANGALTPVATYKAGVQTAINSAKVNGADVVLMTAVPSSGIDFTVYTKALYELADANDLPLIDEQDRWGTWASASANGWMSDALHPNAAGYSQEATSVVNALMLAL